jgi:hypothetical protein
MIENPNFSRDEYEDDGAARLAIVGVFIVIATIAGGVMLNLAL